MCVSAKWIVLVGNWRPKGFESRKAAVEDRPGKKLTKILPPLATKAATHLLAAIPYDVDNCQEARDSKHWTGYCTNTIPRNTI